MKLIAPHLYQIALGPVNTFIIEGDDLTLVDTGYKGSEKKLFKAIKKGGKNPQNIKRIILTHTHPDHAGCAASLCHSLGVPLYVHQEDAQLIEQGIAGRLPFVVSPGWVNQLIFQKFIKNIPNEIGAIQANELLSDQDVIPIAGGLQVIHTPGHSRGHIALLLKDSGVLIAGDICANMIGLGLSTVYEDRELGIKSILKVASYDFNTAVFGHGRTIKKSANMKLKAKFQSKV